MAVTIPLTPPESWRTSIGLAMILCGQPIGWALRGQLFGAADKNPALPALMILIGLALLAQTEWLSRLRLYCGPVVLAIPVLGLLVPFIMFSLLAPGPIMAMTFAYSVVVLLVAFGVAMMPEARLARLPEAVLLIGTLSSVTPLIELAFRGPVKGYFRLTVSGNDNPLIIGSIAGLTAIAGVMVGLGGRGGARVGLAAGIGTAIGLTTMVLTNSRSSIGMAIVCILLYVFLLRRRSAAVPGKRGRWRSVAFIAVLATGATAVPLLAISLIGADALFELLTTSGERFAGALAVVNASAGNVDISTAIRGQMLRDVWENLTVAGHGYMAQAIESGNPAMYPHLTYAQAFYDLGIAGGLAYLLIALILPTAMVVTRFNAGPMRPTLIFTILLFVFSQGDHLAHGTPYSWTQMTPMVLVFTLLGRARQRSMPQGTAARTQLA